MVVPCKQSNIGTKFTIEEIGEDADKLAELQDAGDGDCTKVDGDDHNKGEIQ